MSRSISSAVLYAWGDARSSPLRSEIQIFCLSSPSQIEGLRLGS